MRLHCLRRRTRLRQRLWHGNRGAYPPPRCLRTEPFPITPFGGCTRGATPFTLFTLFPNRHIRAILRVVVNAPKPPQFLRLQPAHLPPILHSGTCVSWKSRSTPCKLKWY